VRRRRLLTAVANHAVLLGVSAAFLFPVLFMFFTAVQSDSQALTGSVWPHPFVWSNFSKVFHR
jgi:multiple sugar transport system permease protein